MPEGDRGADIMDPVKRAEAVAAFKRRKPQSIWNSVLFFPDHNITAPGSATNLFLEYLENAKMCIQICHSFISFLPLEELILRRKKEGLCIQIVTDQKAWRIHKTSSCPAFEREGIPVYRRKISHLADHKFILIDDEAVIMGSMDLTTQGFTGAPEDVFVSTNTRWVSKCSTAFRFMVHDYEKAEPEEEGY